MKTIINIGTSLGNIVGVEIDKDFNLIEYSDITNIVIAKFGTNKKFSVFGWAKGIKFDLSKPIDKVSTEYLDIALRMYGIQLNLNTIDIIIDLVELIKEKGGDLSITDISKLKKERNEVKF